MEKVYCINCRHYRMKEWQDAVQLYWHHEDMCIYPDNQIMKGDFISPDNRYRAYLKEPEEINHDGNCAWFEQKPPRPPTRRELRRARKAAVGGK